MWSLKKNVPAHEHPFGGLWWFLIICETKPKISIKRLKASVVQLLKILQFLSTIFLPAYCSLCCLWPIIGDDKMEALVPWQLTPSYLPVGHRAVVTHNPLLVHWNFPTCLSVAWQTSVRVYFAKGLFPLLKCVLSLWLEVGPTFLAMSVAGCPVCTLFNSSFSFSVSVFHCCM